MQRPKTLAETGWRESSTELVALYLATVLGTAHLLSLNWIVAVLVAPLFMAIILAVIFTLVQMLWLGVVSLDKLGTSLGFRKSPLA